MIVCQSKAVVLSVHVSLCTDCSLLITCDTVTWQAPAAVRVLFADAATDLVNCGFAGCQQGAGQDRGEEAGGPGLHHHVVSPAASLLWGVWPADTLTPETAVNGQSDFQLLANIGTGPLRLGRKFSFSKNVARHLPSQNWKDQGK